MARDWIDVSVPIRSGMARWPGDPPVLIERAESIKEGGACNLTLLAMPAHCGTHVDAPAHYLPGGAGVDKMPPGALIGPCRVIEIRGRVSVNPEELRRHRIRRGERLLLKTRGAARYWRTDSFIEDFVYVSKEAARFLAGRGVLAVGVDYLSVGGYKHDLADTHRILLEAGVWIIEGLNLSKVKPGRYELACLPLRIEGADGAPARALLRR